MTDESGVALGELEFTITDDIVAYRFATGLCIDQDEAPRDILRQLSTNEVAALFKEGANISNTTAYVLGDDRMTLLFLRPRRFFRGAYHVIILGFSWPEADAVFGPTILFTPEQVAAGYFDKAIKKIERKQRDPGVIPRLSNDGQRIEHAA